VLPGWFAKEINAAFPNSKLHLFDTFHGFVDQDIISDVAEKSVIEAFSREFSQTLVQTLLDKMVYPDSVMS
jgi:hypothetical protein